MGVLAHAQQNAVACGQFTHCLRVSSDCKDAGIHIVLLNFGQQIDFVVVEVTWRPFAVQQRLDGAGGIGRNVDGGRPAQACQRIGLIGSE
jgi:hypothetical protein